MLNVSLSQILCMLPAVILGFTLHEYAHAAVAVRLGDRTPIDQGRYTLNPMSHVSLFGLAMMLLVGFGWAKPVQFNAVNFKRPRLFALLVVVAGPAANFLAGFLFLSAFELLREVVSSFFQTPGLGEALYRILSFCIWINLLLFLFNLLPIPPLDGSYLALEAIPARFAAFRRGFLRYGALVFLGLVVVQTVTRVTVFPIAAATSWLLSLLVGLLAPRTG